MVCSVSAELFYPVRFYTVLSVVTLGVAGLWYASLPNDRLYLPPLPFYRQLMRQSMQAEDPPLGAPVEQANADDL